MLVGQLSLTTSWTPPYTTGTRQRLKWQSSWCIWRADSGSVWPCVWTRFRGVCTHKVRRARVGVKSKGGIFGNDTTGVCHVPSQVPFPCAGPAGRLCCLQSLKLSPEVSSVCPGVRCSSSPAGQLRVVGRAACAGIFSSLVAGALLSWQQHQLTGSACRKAFQATPHKGSTRLFVNWISVWDAAKCYTAHAHITKQQGFAVLLHSHARSDIFLFNLKAEYLRI